MPFTSLLKRAAQEPPFRLLVKHIVRQLPVSIRVKADWDSVFRPYYAVGVLKAADEAIRGGQREISVIEFGVAGGEGILNLQDIAEKVEKHTSVKIRVYGFDTGSGLPKSTGDFRDHPDVFQPGDYPMNEQWLRAKLRNRTTLILGDIAETVPRFVEQTQQSPLGFVAIDLDLYSSTLQALRIFTLPHKQMLHHVPIYFDDVAQIFYHRYGGELLAIDEFNATNSHVKIDHWRGISKDRAFPESAWLQQMYVAHDLEALSNVRLTRRVHQRPS